MYDTARHHVKRYLSGRSCDACTTRYGFTRHCRNTVWYGRKRYLIGRSGDASATRYDITWYGKIQYGIIRNVY